jgi:hypothetical protein
MARGAGRSSIPALWALAHERPSGYSGRVVLWRNMAFVPDMFPQSTRHVRVS